VKKYNLFLEHEVPDLPQKITLKKRKKKKVKFIPLINVLKQKGGMGSTE